MSVINTAVKPFKAHTFKQGKFIEVTDADTKGKWAAFFYPADFTFVCPHRVGRRCRPLWRALAAWCGSVFRFKVDLSARGEIIVDHHGRTSVPGVFAAGDCTTVPYKQIVIAAGDGAKASLDAFDYLVRTTVPDREEDKAA